jgi:hypothetical protein
MWGKRPALSSTTGLTLGNLKTLRMSANITDRSSFFVIYTVPKYDGNDKASWYGSRVHVTNNGLPDLYFKPGMTS